MFSEILTTVRDIGPVSLTIAVLVYAFVRLLDSSSHDNKSYAELLQRHLELERKFTTCREELAQERGEKEKVAQAQGYELEKWLDETKDFDRELSTERAKNAELEQRLIECSETILILQGLNQQLKAKSAVTTTENQGIINENQKELTDKD